MARMRRPAAGAVRELVGPSLPEGRPGRTGGEDAAPLDAGAGYAGAVGIAELYDEVDAAIGTAFPRARAIWVRGEVQSLSDRTGHCYIDLVDPERGDQRQAPVLKVKCWRSAWAQISGEVRRAGLELVPGTVVVIRGTLDFYRPRAELGFILAELDVTALLGRLAAQRAALLAALEAEHLIERNRAIAVPDVPMRVGLVASPGTEGAQDFLGQLAASGLAFSVHLVPAIVQGPGAPASVASALGVLVGTGVDVAVIVRGGGSRADLGAFDSETVARAVATCPLPVWTGIGHTGDQSVADLVANHSSITPTECGQSLVQKVVSWQETHVRAPAAAVARGATSAVEREHRSARDARTRLVSSARHQVRWHGERLAARTATVRGGAPQIVEAARQRLCDAAGRLGPLAQAHLAQADTRMVSWGRLLNAYDVQRQLERGYSLTCDDSGAVIRSVSGLSGGSVLTTRFADGRARSVVEGIERIDGPLDPEEAHEPMDGHGPAGRVSGAAETGGGG